VPAFLIGRQEFHIDCKFVFIQHCPPPACLYNTAHHLRIVYTTRPTTCVFIQHCPPPACLYNTAHHLRVYTTLPTTCVFIQHCPPPACVSNTAHHLRVYPTLPTTCVCCRCSPFQAAPLGKRHRPVQRQQQKQRLPSTPSLKRCVPLAVLVVL